MMSNVFEIQAELRTETGKAAMRRMRRLDGRIPAVIYGAGKDAQSITLDHNEISTALGREAMYSHILTLNVGGQSEKVVLKDIQRHPFKPKVVHVDFLRINAKEALVMNVPVHFLGEEDAPGAKAGGVVSKMMTDLEVRCLPGNLPEFIELDMSALEVDHTIHLSDVKLPKGVELTLELSEEHNPGVVSISTPKAEAEPEVTEGDAAEGDAPAAGDEKASAGDADEKKD
jgi:large subunit ribosomal protein L25